MPHRIVEVFDLDKNAEKGKSRYNKICSYSYTNEELVNAEKHPVSEGAIPVGDDEVLARILEDPTSVSHVELGLEYTPAAFGDASKWGLSVQRLSMTSAESVEAFGIEKASSKNRKYVGFAESLAGVLRAGLSPESRRRMLGVFATPNNDVPAHADIYVVLRPTKEEKEEIKYLFWSSFNLDQAIKEFGIAESLVG